MNRGLVQRFLASISRSPLMVYDIMLHLQITRRCESIHALSHSTPSVLNYSLLIIGTNFIHDGTSSIPAHSEWSPLSLQPLMVTRSQLLRAQRVPTST